MMWTYWLSIVIYSLLLLYALISEIYCAAYFFYTCHYVVVGRTAVHIPEEYRWDWQSTSVKQALLIGPPRNTGLICPLYVASREALEDDELQDVFSYALTTTEEDEEEQLISKFDPFDKWVTVETQQDLVSVQSLDIVHFLLFSKLLHFSSSQESIQKLGITLQTMHDML